MDAFFSWELLGTFSGAVAAVVFIVQLLKLPLDKVWRVPTQYIVYVVSFAVLALAQHFVLGGLTWDTLALVLLNSVLVALSAMSLYEQAISAPESVKSEKYTLELVEALNASLPSETTETIRARDRESETAQSDEDDG